MSEREDRGLPERPDGAEGFGANGHDAPDVRGIVPVAGQAPARRGAPAWLSYLLCAFGGGSMAFMPLLGSFFVGYGVLSACDGRREQLGGAVVTCLVAAAASSLYLGGGMVVAESVAACAVAVATAVVVVLGLMGPGAACALVGVGTVLVLGVDAATAALAGSSISESVMALVDAYVSALDATSVDAQLIVSQVRDIMGLFWPLSYVTIALGLCLFSQLGARMAIRSRGLGALVGAPFSEFDLPLWPVAVLVAAVLGAALGQGLGEGRGSLVYMVSLNVLMALRFAFAAQGFAILVWFARERRLPSGGVIFIAMIGLFLEVRFFVMSIAGLADFWLNFRRLGRGGAASAQGTQQQE